MTDIVNNLDSTATKSFLGYLIAFSALGQALFSPLIGWWSNQLKSSRIPFLVTLVICIISYLIHATLESFHPRQRKYWMLFSRFLAGVGSANVSLCRSHVSTTTTLKERRKAVSILSSCATLGLALGPVLQLAVVKIGDKGFWLVEDYLKLDMYTAMTWIVIFLTVFNLILFHPYIFKEYSMLGKDEIVPTKDTYQSENYKYLAWTFICMNFMLTFNFMYTKILGTPMAMDEFAMSRPEAITFNAIVMSVGAVISFISILLIQPMCRIITEMKVLLMGVSVMILGRAFFYPWGDEPPKVYNDILCGNDATGAECEGKPSLGCPISQGWCATERKVLFSQYILGNVLENFGYSIAITLVMAIFSKVLGSKQQGTWMGFLTAIGSLARITSPVFISSMYENFGPGVVTIVTNLIFVVVATIFLKMINKLIDNKERELGELNAEDDLMNNQCDTQGSNSKSIT